LTQKPINSLYIHLPWLLLEPLHHGFVQPRSLALSLVGQTHRSQTAAGSSCCGTLQDHTIIKRKHPSMLMRNGKLHNIAHRHVSSLQCPGQTAPHAPEDYPPYSLDLPPCDFHMFSPLRKL
jgi:hypothetical protein